MVAGGTAADCRGYSSGGCAFQGQVLEDLPDIDGITKFYYRLAICSSLNIYLDYFEYSFREYINMYFFFLDVFLCEQSANLRKAKFWVYNKETKDCRLYENSSGTMR